MILRYLTFLCKAKMPWLLTFQVSTYYLLDLQSGQLPTGRLIPGVFYDLPVTYISSLISQTPRGIMPPSIAFHRRRISHWFPWPRVSISPLAFSLSSCISPSISIPTWPGAYSLPRSDQQSQKAVAAYIDKVAAAAFWLCGSQLI